MSASPSPPPLVMRAVQIERFGPIEQLPVREVRRPTTAPGEVLVRVEAASVNPSDVKNVQGSFPITTLPRIPGRDMAGTVVVGPSDLMGAPVWGAGGAIGYTRDGTHAEYVIFPAAGVRRRPSSLSPASAAAAGVAFTTAWQGLIGAAHVQPGETVLAIGSSGAVGMAVTQIARWAGARVVGVDRRPPTADTPGAVRPDVFIDASTADMGAAVRDAIGHGADVAFNAVGGVAFDQHLAALRRGGRMVSIASVGQRRVTFDLLDFYHQELQLIGGDSLQLDTATSAAILDRLAVGFIAGALVPPVVGREYPLAEARAAYADVAAGNTTGKVVIVP